MLRIAYTVLSFGFLAGAANAAVPTQINHQGVVSVSGQRFTGNGSFYFAIIDPGSGNSVWTNDGTNIGTANRPIQLVTLSCVNGLYNVRLGDTLLANMTPVTADVFSAENRALRIWFDDGTNGVFRLTPDHPLTSVPYAFRAAEVGSDIPITRVYTTNDTWNKPLGLKHLEVEVIGGGGGGQGGAGGEGDFLRCGSGGGGGGYSRETIDAGTLRATETITIGTGGSGGAYSSNNGAAGSIGGNTTFGGHCTGGGGAGAPSDWAQPGAGGLGSGGDFNAYGDNGAGGTSTGSSTEALLLRAGKGGKSIFGAGGNGDDGPSLGGGGAGGLANTGQTGAAGVVIVKEYF